ncbi:hypothetical protein QAD02_020176, partial [Eretmocerus hayati]
ISQETKMTGLLVKVAFVIVGSAINNDGARAQQWAPPPWGLPAFGSQQGGFQQLRPGKLFPTTTTAIPSLPQPQPPPPPPPPPPPSPPSIPSSDGQCQCVAYYQCTASGYMNIEGDGVIDIRSGLVPEPNSEKRKPCAHYLEVCCRDNERNNVTTKQPGINTFPVDPSKIIPGGGSEIVPWNPTQANSEYPSQVTPGYQQQGQTDQGNNNAKDPNVNYNAPTHTSRGCGYRNPNGISFRITGNKDNEANFAEFPWMVAVFRSQSLSGKLEMVYQCGGSLIHRRVVLTAAHCVADKVASDIYIRAGEWDTKTQNEPLPHQDRRVAAIETHPSYKPRSLLNDFALLILDTPVDLADNIEIACLPKSNEGIESNNCFATGWGRDKFGDRGSYQVILKAVELPTVAHQTCQTQLRETRLGKRFELHNSFMCAGGKAGKDTCTGDGGSPLVCPLPSDQNRYVQVGIVAWGIGCAQENVPGVYADVSKARDWIDARMDSHSIDKSSYTPSSADYDDPSNADFALFDQRKFYQNQG